VSTGRSIFTRPDQSVWQPFLAIGEARPKYRWRSFRNCSRSTRWKGSSPASPRRDIARTSSSRWCTARRLQLAPTHQGPRPASNRNRQRPRHRPHASHRHRRDRRRRRLTFDRQTITAQPPAIDAVFQLGIDCFLTGRWDEAERLVAEGLGRSEQTGITLLQSPATGCAL